MLIKGLPSWKPGRLAQSSQRSWVRYPVWPHTFVSPSADLRGTVVNYWRKYVHEALVNRLAGLSLPRKSVVRLTHRPDMTLYVYRGCKTTKQQQQKILNGSYFEGNNWLPIRAALNEIETIFLITNYLRC